MTTQPVTIDKVMLAAPKIALAYREAFKNAQAIFDKYGISKSNLRIAHFFAQILHETAGLTIQYENLNYSAARLIAVWPSRFGPGKKNPNEYANNPMKLANFVYANRMGNEKEGDGFKYRGRGLLQLTGKDAYARVTGILKKVNANAPDFVANPDEAVSVLWCVEAACAVWKFKGCNELADQDRVDLVTKAINGGKIGLEDRIKCLSRVRQIWRC